MKDMTYEEVTTELAKHLMVDDPLKIRLTQHNVYSSLPFEKPMKYNGLDSLELMVLPSGQHIDILHYEILDMPLIYAEKMKRLRLAFHSQNAKFQSEYRIVVHKDKTVDDLVVQLKTELGEDYAMCDIRVMEILFSKAFRVTISHCPLQQDHEQ